MKEVVEILVREVISLTGLSILPGLPGHGSGYDYELGWSGRRTERMPENFFAQVHICGNELELGFYIEVRAYGYDLVTHDGFSELYWGRTINTRDLENKREELIREIENVVVKAWDDLPVLRQKMLMQKDERERLLEQLRREEKLIE